MDGIANSLLKSDYYYCFLVEICVILWFAKQIQNIEFTADPSKIKQADFVIIAVPTPVTKSNLMRQTCDT